MQKCWVSEAEYLLLHKRPVIEKNFKNHLLKTARFEELSMNGPMLYHKQNEEKKIYFQNRLDVSVEQPTKFGLSDMIEYPGSVTSFIMLEGLMKICSFQYFLSNIQHFLKGK